MDIKDLNKPQLILLAVLLSFVTSIATGITTVTLMQQAPASFTEPVNRVIKQTVEKIQQVEGKTVTQTVIVKEEDLVVDAIAKNKSAVFSITRNGEDSNNQNVELSAGNGFVINNEGVLVSDTAWVANEAEYFVTNSSGKFRAQFLFSNEGGFSFLKIGEPAVGTSKAVYTVPVFGDFSKTKIGQKIIILGSNLSSFIFDGSTNIKSNIGIQNAGGLVFNLDAEVLGIALSGEGASFASIDAINTAYKAGQ